MGLLHAGHFHGITFRGDEEGRRLSQWPTIRKRMAFAPESSYGFVPRVVVLAVISAAASDNIVDCTTARRVSRQANKPSTGGV